MFRRALGSEVFVIAAVHRNDVIECVKIICADPARLLCTQINATLQCSRRGAFVGSLANVVGMRSGRVNFNIFQQFIISHEALKNPLRRG